MGFKGRGSRVRGRRFRDLGFRVGLELGVEHCCEYNFGVSCRLRRRFQLWGHLFRLFFQRQVVELPQIFYHCRLVVMLMPLNPAVSAALASAQPLPLPFLQLAAIRHDCKAVLEGLYEFYRIVSASARRTVA